MSKPNLTFDSSVEPWNKPFKQWLSDHEKTWDGIASSALVFDSDNRLLLVQRAADDSMPNLWETPGGACDPEDPSILAGCARELFEEAGLTAKHIVRNVSQGEGGPEFYVFTNSKGNRLYVQFAFQVEVDDVEEVKLDPVEHQAYVWATEEQIRKGRVEMEGGHTVFIPITTDSVRRLIYEGFRLRTEHGKK